MMVAMVVALVVLAVAAPARVQVPQPEPAAAMPIFQLGSPCKDYLPGHFSLNVAIFAASVIGK